MMIVSPVISQKRYIINNDTIVGYNKYENRKIAIFIAERDKYKSINELDSIELDNHVLLETVLHGQIINYQSENKLIQARYEAERLKSNKYMFQLNKSNIAKSKWRIGCISVSLLTLSYILLK